MAQIRNISGSYISSCVTVHPSKPNILNLLPLFNLKESNIPLSGSRIAIRIHLGKGTMYSYRLSQANPVINQSVHLWVWKSPKRLPYIVDAKFRQRKIDFLLEKTGISPNCHERSASTTTCRQLSLLFGLFGDVLFDDSDKMCSWSLSLWRSRHSLSWGVNFSSYMNEVKRKAN